MWHTSDMTPDQARTALRTLAQERKRVTDAEPAAIVNALKLGVKQADIARDLERTREHIRRVARAHGIDSDR